MHTKTKMFLSLFLAWLAISVPVASVLAFPPLPSSFYGQVQLNGQFVPAGAQVRAMIGGTVYATANVMIYEGTSVYTLDVPGDDLSTPSIREGGREGETLQFWVGDVLLTQSGVWHTGTNVKLDLMQNQNRAPQASNDSYSLSEDNSLHVAARGLLANDSDAENDPMTANLVSGPAFGTLTLRPDGSFDYVPSLNFNDKDAFTYSANDGHSSSNAVVTLTINPVNDAPTVRDDDAIVNKDKSTRIDLGLLAADVETSDENLTYILDQAPAHGTITRDGQFWTYTPHVDSTAPDTFRFSVRDTGDPSGCAGASPSCSAVLTSSPATITVKLVQETTTSYLFFIPIVRR